MLQPALHCISPTYCGSFGPHGHTTAHFCPRNRRVDIITRPTLRVLSKSIAKIVVLQFRSIDRHKRIDLHSSWETDSAGREVDCALLLELHTLLVFRVLRGKTHRHCLPKHCHTEEFRVHFPKSSQSTQLEPHHQQTSSPANPHLLLHRLHTGSGDGTSPPAAVRSATAAIIRPPHIVRVQKAPCSGPKCCPAETRRN